MHLGKKIKLARITKGYTQQELADLIGKTRPLISLIEQKGTVNTYTLQDIEKALGVELGDSHGKANEPLPDPLENGKSISSLKLENEKLLAEIAGLKVLMESQKEVIESQRELILMLKEKVKK